MTHITINIISLLLAGIPWGMIPYGNIKLQKIGIGIQIFGLCIMIINLLVMVLK